MEKPWFRVISDSFILKYFYFSGIELSDETLNKYLNEIILWNHPNYKTNNQNPDRY
jgi:hypothetical protein